MVGAENRQQNLYLGVDLVPSLSECSGENTTPWAAFVVPGRRWGRGSGTGTAGARRVGAARAPLPAPAPQTLPGAAARLGVSSRGPEGHLVAAE